MAKDITHPGADPLAKPEWAMSRRERKRAERARQGLPPPRRKWPWVLLVLLVAAAAAAWVERERVMAMLPPPPAEEPAVAEPEPDPVPGLTQINASEWTRVEPATLRRTVRVLGSLAPARRAGISAETGGLVQAVHARAGDAVEEGEVLVELDLERLTLDLDQARSNVEATRSQLALAEAQLARSQELVQRGVSAETTLDEVRTNVEGVRANLSSQEDQVRGAELALERATVTAPFAGVVAERTVEPGNVVGAGTPLMTLVDLDRMELLAQAPVASGALVRPGQPVTLRVDGVPDRTFRGEVSRVAPQAQEGTRTLTVYVTLDNEDGTLLGGMFATGEIVLAEVEEALAVPRSAVREDAEGAHLLVIADGAVERRAVSLGEEWQGRVVQVLDGLAPGDAVVTAPLEGLEDGEAVELVEF